MSKKPKLTDVPGLGAKMEEKLIEAGIKTVLKLSRAKADKLGAKVDGLSEKGAQKLIDAAQKLVPSKVKEPKKVTKKKAKVAKEAKPKKTAAKKKPKAVEKKPKETPKKEEKPAKKKPKEEKKKPVIKEKKIPPKKAEKPKAKPKAPVKAAVSAPKKKPKKKPVKKKPRAAKKVEPKPELLTKMQVVESRIFRVAAAKKRKQPLFRHEQAHRWIRVSDSWRKVRGIDSKTREKRKGRIAMPTSGYRKPKAVRGIHPSGFIEVLVYRPSELDELNPDMHAVRIGSTVGLRKRQEILKKAETLTLRVLNPGAPETVMEEELFSELDMIEEVEVE
jgi:large subunit ribosomal protein L32e